MFIVPTWRRPEKIRRLIQSLNDTQTSAPGLILIQGEDQKQEYLDAIAERPKNWEWLCTNVNVGWVHALNFLLKYKPQDNWYGVINDDHRPVTVGWDQKMLALAQPWGMVTCIDNDRETQWRASGPLILGGELVRATGFFMPPCTWHICGDDWWQFIGRAFGIWKVAANVRVDQDSPIFAGAAHDETHASAYGTFHEQREQYHKWLASEGGSVAERLRIRMQAAGALGEAENGRFTIVNGKTTMPPEWIAHEGPTAMIRGVNAA